MSAAQCAKSGHPTYPSRLGGDGKDASPVRSTVGNLEEQKGFSTSRSESTILRGCMTFPES